MGSDAPPERKVRVPVTTKKRQHQTPSGLPFAESATADLNDLSDLFGALFVDVVLVATRSAMAFRSCQ